MLLAQNDKSFKQIIEILKSGEVVVMVCDTIYGFVGLAPETENKLRILKNRTENSPFIQLISDKSDLATLSLLNPKTPILDLWPGPFTFIFDHISSNISSASVACRVPADRRLRTIILSLNQPLYSTSVNESGQSFLNDAKQIHERFGNQVAIVEDAGVIQNQEPSTLIDVRQTPHKILRPGAGKIPPGYMHLFKKDSFPWPVGEPAIHR